jgi:ribosomal protein S18
MKAPGGPRRPFFRRRKTCPFSAANAPKIDQIMMFPQQVKIQLQPVVPVTEHQ